MEQCSKIYHIRNKTRSDPDDTDLQKNTKVHVKRFLDDDYTYVTTICMHMHIMLQNSVCGVRVLVSQRLSYVGYQINSKKCVSNYTSVIFPC